MGGNALRNAETRRYEKQEYMDLCKEVSAKLDSLFPFIRHDVIKSYKNKESFGDMDIIIEVSNLPDTYVKLILDEFHSKDHVKNGNVLSFEYKNFQIDLIGTKPSEYETSYNYFAYNDLGNLCGRLAHSIGLKLGHDGLSYNWRIETYQYTNVILSKSWKTILHALDLSYEKYEKGFDDLEDIFKFVMSSKFYNKEIFLLQNRNNVSRTRDRKRKTYNQFLEYINPENIDYPETLLHNKKDKSIYLPYLFDVIPGFKHAYDQISKDYEEEIFFKRVYNGDLVREWTGLTDKELGWFMRWMKEKYADGYLKQKVLSLNPEVLKPWVQYNLDFYLEEKFN